MPENFSSHFPSSSRSCPSLLPTLLSEISIPYSFLIMMALAPPPPLQTPAHSQKFELTFPSTSRKRNPSDVTVDVSICRAELSRRIVSISLQNLHCFRLTATFDNYQYCLSTFCSSCFDAYEKDPLFSLHSKLLYRLIECSNVSRSLLFKSYKLGSLYESMMLHLKFC